MEFRPFQLTRQDLPVTASKVRGAVFSSKCAIEAVPGIGSMTGEMRKQATERHLRGRCAEPFGHLLTRVNRARSVAERIHEEGDAERSQALSTSSDFRFSRCMFCTETWA